MALTSFTWIDLEYRLPLHICHLESFLEAAHHKPTTTIQAEHMNSHYFMLFHISGNESNMTVENPQILADIPIKNAKLLQTHVSFFFRKHIVSDFCGMRPILQALIDFFSLNNLLI